MRAGPGGKLQNARTVPADAGFLQVSVATRKRGEVQVAGRQEGLSAVALCSFRHSLEGTTTGRRRDGSRAAPADGVLPGDLRAVGVPAVYPRSASDFVEMLSDLDAGLPRLLAKSAANWGGRGTLWCVGSTSGTLRH